MTALTSPPPPSKVTAAPDVKEDPVAVINGLRLGTSTEAGAECVTSRSPRGIDGELYRFYMRTQGAPGPYLVRDPITKNMVPARDEEGRELFDLDAVKAWNESRPGPGARTGRPVKWTRMRQDLLTATRDGQLVRAATGRPFHLAVELDPRQLQRIGELIAAGLIAEPRGRGGKYRITAAGERWLDQNARTTCTT